MTRLTLVHLRPAYEAPLTPTEYEAALRERYDLLAESDYDSDWYSSEPRPNWAEQRRMELLDVIEETDRINTEQRLRVEARTLRRRMGMR